MNSKRNGANFADSTDAVFDPYRARQDFPVLAQQVHGKPLVYLDNAATTHKPQSVIDATVKYYAEDNSNVHRGLHTLSERATRDYEGARDKLQRFINASSRGEVLYTSGTTNGINLVAQSYVRPRLKPDDEIIISHMEHHSNIVPWQLVCEQTGAKLKVVPVNDRGELEFDAYLKLLNPRTRFVSMVHLSNSLGTINPIEEVIKAAHAQNVKVLVDGAQAISRLSVDVQALDCDFYAMSGHKIYGPTGTGVLFGRETLLDEMSPYEGGGDMIRTVSFEGTTYNDLPYKFEAGTPNIAGAVGLGAAVDYLVGHGVDAVDQHERVILDYATQAVADVPGLRIIGTAENKAGVLAFVLEGAHAHDVGTILDTQGVAVRAGHHCTMPLMERFDIPATARASFALYNTREDVDALISGLQKTIDIFGS